MDRMTEIRHFPSMVFPSQVDKKKVVKHKILWYTQTGKCSDTIIKKGKN